MVGADEPNAEAGRTLRPQPHNGHQKGSPLCDVVHTASPTRGAKLLFNLKEAKPMDSSHIATGTITALLATALVYLTHWPLQPLDLPTAAAFAGLLVAVGGAAVKFYKSRTAPIVEPLAPVVSITPPNTGHESSRAA